MYTVHQEAQKLQTRFSSTQNNKQ